MDSATQWGVITTIVGILTFLAGRFFEQRKLAQANRLKLLEPVEEWVQGASRIIGIVGDDISAIAVGLPSPIGYSPRDRIEAGKALAESKAKVLGILRSHALTTWGTRKFSVRLSTLVNQLSLAIEREYMPAHSRLLDKMNRKEDLSVDMMALVATASAINVIIQEIHMCLSQLKIRFT